MKAYAHDLRERVLSALDCGMPRSEVVSTFQVNLASLKRWHAARRDTGDFSPHSLTGGFEPTIPPEQYEQLRAQVAAFPDAPLAEHATRWNAATPPRSASGPSAGLSELLPHAQQKSLIAAERDPWERARFLIAQAAVDPADGVVIDEFGSNLDLTRRYARAPRGERAVASLPRNTPANTTTISALTTSGIEPRLMTAGGVTSTLFEA